MQTAVERHPTAEYVAPRGGVGRTIAAIVTVIALAAAIALILFLTKRSPKTAAHLVAPPNVVQMTEGQAETRLQDLGFAVGNVTYKIVDSGTAAPGIVVAQSPDSHTLVNPGSKVDLTVAGIRMPDVTGKDAKTAGAILARDGFTSTPTTRSGGTNDLPAGQVISTDPPGGQVVGPTTGIVLTVSAGPQQITVPDVSGKSLSDAEAALTAQGFTNFQPVNQPSNTVPQGQVISTNPPANAKATKLDTITINVSSGPSSVNVPDVTGDSDVVACQILQNKNLGCREHFVDDPNNVGLVISTDPPPNTPVPPNSSVTITVGREPSATTTTTASSGTTTTT